MSPDSSGGPGGSAPAQDAPSVGGVGVPARAAGFGLAFAWISVIPCSTYGLRTGVGLSALSLFYLAQAALLGGLALLVVKGRVRGEGPLVRAAGVVGVLAATVCAALGATASPSGVAAAALSVVGGPAAGAALGAAVLGVSRLDSADRARAVVGGAVLAGILEALLALTQHAPSAIPVLGIAVMAALACAGVMLCCAGGGLSLEASYRPSKSQHFRLLVCALLMYVFIFGASTGVDAVTAAFVGVSLADLASALLTPLVFSAVAGSMLLIAQVRGQEPGLRLVGRVLTPVLAVLFLSFIVLPDEGRRWLPPLTDSFWRLVEIYVLLTVMDIARSGVASPVLAYAAGWGALCLSFAVGTAFGQGMDAVFGSTSDVVSNITVLYTLVAVLASTLAMWAGQPSGASPSVPGLAGGSVSGGQGEAPAEGQDDGRPARDAVGAACGRLVERYGLSEREAEVCELLTRGNTRAGIATRLYVSENTVRTHVKNVYAKLHIHSKQQLVNLVDEEVAAAGGR